MNKSLQDWLAKRNLIPAAVRGGVGTPPRTPPRRQQRAPPPSPEQAAAAPPVEPINPNAVLQRLGRRLQLEPDSEPSTRATSPAEELKADDSDSDSDASTISIKKGSGKACGCGGSKPIVMKRKDFFNEHHKLIGMMRDISKRLATEADEQEKEMNSYKQLKGGVYCGNKRPPPGGQAVGSTLQCFKKGVGVGMTIERNKIPTDEELHNMSLRKLGELARQLKIPRYSRMKKEDLIEEIIVARRN